MTDEGAGKSVQAPAFREKRESERMCAVTREALPAGELIRFVASPEGVLTPDLARRLPGRGVHVALSAARVREAVRRKVFERALKRPISVPATLAEDVAQLMRRDLLQSLALANKAGLVVTGFQKVEQALAGGRAAALLEASDGAEDGRRKLAQAARRGGGREALSVILGFSSRDFELAFGPQLVIHAALLPGPAAEGCLARWRRLVRYESGATAAPDTGLSQKPDDQPAGPLAE